VRSYFFVGIAHLLLTPLTVHAIDRHMPVSVGEYRLGQKVSEAPRLTEFTSSEYAAFSAAGWTKVVADERIFKGPERVAFQNAYWKMMVGATNGRIFKISLQKVSYDPTAASTELFNKLRDDLTRQIGQPSQHMSPPERYIWDAVEGNLILERLDVANGHAVNIFLTGKQALLSAASNGPDRRGPVLAGQRQERGWHLISPPIDNHGVRTDLPLGQWKISLEEFDTREACLKYREAYLNTLRTSTLTDLGSENFKQVEPYLKQKADHTECIGPSDPRFPK